MESFGLSPRNEAVMAAVGHLKRVFPGPTLALDRSTFNEPDFRKAVAPDYCPNEQPVRSGHDTEG